MRMHCARPATRSVRRTLHLVVVGAVLASCVGLVTASGAPAAGPKPLFEEVGTLERFPEDARAALGAATVPLPSGSTPPDQISGTAIIIPEARQLWQIYAMGSQARTGVVVRDLDSLRIEHSMMLNVMLERSTIEATQGGDWMYALDTAGMRIFLVAGQAPNRHIELLEMSLKDFTVKRRPLFGSLVPTGNILLGGLAYDRFEDEVVLLYGGLQASSAGNFNTFVARLDVSGPPAATFDPGSMYRVRSCTGPITATDAGDDTYDWEPLITKDHLYVPCQRSGHTVIVVRMARPAASRNGDATHAEDVTAGPVYGEAVMADQEGRRLFVVSIDQEIWVFEAGTMSFVGVVATGPAGLKNQAGYGLDRSTGRVFFQSPGFGLGVVEGRFFPIPQARTSEPRTKGQERILSDAKTGRVFVLHGYALADPGQPTKDLAYRIYRIGSAPLPPASPDPDRNTTNVAEKEGVTEARWNATGSGYGTRVLLAKGYATVVPAPTVGNGAPTQAVTRGAQNWCGFIDRDLFLGRVAKAEYDTGSTAAQAVAVAIDDTTKQDLDQLERCDGTRQVMSQLGRALGQAGAGNPSPGWPYKTASCSSNQVVVPDSPSQAQPDDLGPAEVRCPAPGEVLTARAESTISKKATAASPTQVLAPLSGAVDAQRSWTATTISRLADGGVRSVVEAVARNVSIDLGIAGVDAVQIGEIRSKATSFANGRPIRKDMSTHEIEVSQVRIGDTLLCAASCSDEELLQLEQRLNVISGGRAVFRTGKGPNSGRDDDLLEGSRGGAQTAIQKSTARQTSDRALVGDFTIEIPAFEVTVFNDNPDPNGGWGRARQVYQFAGVTSSATYNIVSRATEIPFPDDIVVEDQALPVAEVDGNLFAGYAESFDADGIPQAASMISTTAGDVNPPGGLAGVVRAVARGLRLFLTSPRTALLLLTAWGLLSTPALLARRRRLLQGVRAL